MQNHLAATELLPQERCFRIASPLPGLELALFHLPPTRPRPGPRHAVLYVHGATFPIALSLAYGFAGGSWRDHLADAGFDVWGLDFLGFGASDRYPEMAMAPERSAPLGRAAIAAEQIAASARFILAEMEVPKLSIIAHSWGTIAACRFAAAHPDQVDRLVLFGPIIERPAPEGGVVPNMPGWRLLTLDQQYARFVEDVPPGETPVLLRHEFDGWGQAYLASDPMQAGRGQRSVAIPLGPAADIATAWHGAMAYDLERITAPVAVLRGEWDSLCTDADVAWLQRAMRNAPEVRDVKLPRGTHLMHLETGRTRLYAASLAFLDAAT